MAVVVSGRQTGNCVSGGTNGTYATNGTYRMSFNNRRRTRRRGYISPAFPNNRQTALEKRPAGQHQTFEGEDEDDTVRLP
jgi:hypothetical protein